MKPLILSILLTIGALAEEAKTTEQFVRFTLDIGRINPTEDAESAKVANAQVTIVANREQLIWFRASETNQWECLRATPLTPVVINADQTAAWTNQAQLKAFFLSKAYEKLAADEIQQAAARASTTNAP